jgi:hypothetical protein
VQVQPRVGKRALVPRQLGQRPVGSSDLRRSPSHPNIMPSTRKTGIRRSSVTRAKPCFSESAGCAQQPDQPDVGADFLARLPDRCDSR